MNWKRVLGILGTIGCLGIPATGAMATPSLSLIDPDPHQALEAVQAAQPSSQKEPTIPSAGTQASLPSDATPPAASSPVASEKTPTAGSGNVAPAAPPSGAEVPTRAMEAEALYRLGLYLMTLNQFDQAQQLFARVLAEYGDTPSASGAAQRKAELEALARLPSAQQPSRKAALANSGRAEFVVAETVLGGYVGAVLPILLEADSGKPILAGAMLGTLTGLGGGLLFTSKHPLTSSQASLIYYGQLFGAANLALWDLGLQGDSLSSGRPPLILSLVGATAGSIAGYKLGQKLEIPDGRVSLMASAGLWTTVLSQLAFFTVVGDSDDFFRARLIMAPMLADVGLATAALVAYKTDFRISRSRMRLINLGGAVGGFLGLGTALLAGAEDERAFFGMTLAGAATGLGVGIGATRHWDAINHPDTLAKTPINSVLAVESRRLKLGAPSPILGWEVLPFDPATEKPSYKPTLSVNLLGGTF